MIPPFLRRCPRCGHVGATRRFAVVAEGPKLVECPECRSRFEPVERPRLQ